jgi:hypothetical protein
VTQLPQIEEKMIDVMAILMGGLDHAPARQVFRSLKSEQARILVLRSMLEEGPLNKEKGLEFDEVISLFDEVRDKRNAYVHGLWDTHTESRRAFLQEASTDKISAFLSEREVKDGEMKAALKRMDELYAKCVALIETHRLSPK